MLSREIENYEVELGSFVSAVEIGLVVLVGLVILGTLIAVVERFRRKTPKTFRTSLSKRAILLNEELEKRKGECLTQMQRRIINESVGLSSWIPKKLHQAWEERIRTFIDTFHIVSADGQVVTEEMKLLVAAEASLLIVNRPMADYRHLRRINLWKTKIQGEESAKGMAKVDEVDISWEFLMQTISDARDGQNLILHEFAHVIDFADDGIAQSIPVSSSSPDYAEWKQVVDEEHERLMNAYESGDNYAIRAYGGYTCTKGDKPEIFSCATSAFFERGSRLRRQTPKLYSMLKKFYGVDPATWRKQKDSQP